MRRKLMNFSIRKVWLISVVLIQLASFAHAQSIRLDWDPDPGAMGYKVYRSLRPNGYTTSPLSGPALLKTPSFTDSTAQSGQTYYYVVTNVSFTGEESNYSNEIAATVSPAPVTNVESALQSSGVHSSELAIMSQQRDSVVVSEAAIPPAPLIQSGRIYVEFHDSVNTGIAIVNPNPEPVVFNFYLTDGNGVELHSSSVTIDANTTIAALLDQPTFAPAADIDLHSARTLTFSSSSQIAFTAIRGFTNERSDYLVTPLPLAATESADASSLVIPNYVEGGPWQSRIILVNPANVPVSGVAEFFTPPDPSLGERWSYTIPAGSATSLQTAAQSDSRSGWIRITPDQSSVSPTAVVVLSFRPNGATDYELGVTAAAEESAFRIYAETSG